MVVDFRSSHAAHSPLYINNELVESVSEYKYLGTIIDCNFNFNKNVTSVYKKLNSRLYFARQLYRLKVDNKIMQLFYMSIIQSVMTFSIVCWYGNTSAESKNKLSRIIKVCEKMNVNTMCIEDLYRKCTVQRCKAILKDQTHPLYCKYTLLPSRRRYRSIKCRTARYSKSFIPSSTRLLNENM
jgi:hypothetical protein